MNLSTTIFKFAAFSTFTFTILFSAVVNYGQPQQEQLLNGLRVVMIPDASASNVTAKLRVHSGAAFDPQGKEGTLCLLSEAFFPNQDARDFFKDDLGGSFQVVCHYDYIELDVASKPESYLTMLETLAASVSNPVIDRQTTDAVKAEMVARLTNEEKDARLVANTAVRKRLLGTFPYGRPKYGTAAGLKVVDFADLKFAYERLFGADNATLVVSGNFPVDNAYRGIRRYFGGWLKLDRKAPSSFKAADPPIAGTQIIESPESGITEIRYAFRGVARNEKDFAAASVFAKVVEARLRSKAPAGQNENVWVTSNANVLPGVFMIGFSRIQQNISAAVIDDKAKTEANDLITNALNATVSEAEFAVANNSARAEYNKLDASMRWLDVDTYRLSSIKNDQAAFESVTTGDVQRFADRLKKQPVASVLLLPKKAN